jgi:hypothetical protein
MRVFGMVPHDSSGRPDVFPGQRAATLTRAGLARLRRSDFLVSHRVDGVRYMLCLENSHDTGHAYFVSRGLNVWRRMDAPTNSALSGTVLDVVCTENAIVVIDVLRVGDIVVASVCPGIMTRLSRASQAIDILRRAWKGVIRVQTFMPKASYMSTMNDAAGLAVAPVDGLVFTPMFGSYVVGQTNFDVLKWKPAELTTVDVVYSPDAHKDRYDVPDHVAPGTIIEIAARDPPFVDDWVFVRSREDKTDPTPSVVAKRTIDAISENVGLDEVYAALKPPLPAAFTPYSPSF